MKLQWFKAIPRQDWQLADSPRVCAKHFSTEDFITTSHDYRAERRATRSSNQLQRL